MSVSIVVQLEDGVSIGRVAQETHGISAEDCSKFGVPRGVALDLFNSALQRADLLVAHNLIFDELVMQAVACREKDNASGKQVGERPRLQRVCTMKSSKDILKLPKWPKLHEAFAHFTNGKEIKNGHDAMVDAEACLTVFRGLVESGSLILEPVLERGEITLKPDYFHIEILTEMHENTEKAPLDISGFLRANQGELLVTPNDRGFDVGGDHTFKHRVALGAFGGRWNPQTRCWCFEGHPDLGVVN
jgi:DNA polymerase III epsilon subunit-like protein